MTIFIYSCGPKLRPVLFLPVRGTNPILFGLSREAAEGLMDFSRPKKLEYRFAAAPSFLTDEPSSFEIEYSLTGEQRLVLETGTHSWVLPQMSNFGDSVFDGVFHYAIPADDFFPEHFSIVPADDEGENRTGKGGHLQIHSINFTERWYGFYRVQNHIYASPFVSPRPEDSAWVIDPPPAAMPDGFFPALSADLLPGKETVIDAGGRRFIFSPHSPRLVIPAGIIAPNMGMLVLPGDRINSFRLVYAQIAPFPAPIAVDPGMVLAWPVEHWRDRRYEVFRWDRFPSLLIFDTADYAVQDRMLKRLAFFVEKAGFRGRLAPDEEITELHGWNAHDYRAEDLARFFQAARKENFPLLAEERELERILLNAGIIQESGAGIQAGEGGIISISRESESYLRSLFMAHEGFHGLFFIDEEFRVFSRGRWQQLPADARRFIVSYFNFQHYDTAEEYLLVNEFMAHLLQQPVSQAGRYFGQTLPSRIENGWRRADLPAKDTSSGSWPTLARAFTREADAFSAYVGSRWGLAAGRVHLVTVRQP
ncbi:MAG: hypothetical protein LBB89_05790 [Treponema sp.]|nr:hypothetical protein [Treponema sp.]